MADAVNYTAASASTPWFAQQQTSDAPTGAANQGDSITSERGILNRQVGGVAGDISDQSDTSVASLTSILNAILARPAA